MKQTYKKHRVLDYMNHVFKGMRSVGIEINWKRKIITHNKINYWQCKCAILQLLLKKLLHIYFTVLKLCERSKYSHRTILCKKQLISLRCKSTFISLLFFHFIVLKKLQVFQYRSNYMYYIYDCLVNHSKCVCYVY